MVFTGRPHVFRSGYRQGFNSVPDFLMVFTVVDAALTAASVPFQFRAGFSYGFHRLRCLALKSGLLKACFRAPCLSKTIFFSMRSFVKFFLCIRSCFSGVFKFRAPLVSFICSLCLVLQAIPYIMNFFTDDSVCCSEHRVWCFMSYHNWAVIERDNAADAFDLAFALFAQLVISQAVVRLNQLIQSVMQTEVVFFVNVAFENTVLYPGTITLQRFMDFRPAPVTLNIVRDNKIHVNQLRIKN